MPKANESDSEKKPVLRVRYEAELVGGTKVGVVAHAINDEDGSAMAIFPSKGGALHCELVSKLKQLK